MQTKNINVDQAPTSITTNNNHSNNTGSLLHQLVPALPEKLRTYQIITSTIDTPPLPPRSAIIFTALPASPKPQVEVDGYGPYKPVPPPKPLPQRPQSSGCLTPPPYRMPPYPLYNEPNIPGSAGLDLSNLTSPVATSSPSLGPNQDLQTHSSKFPIEREVILSSTDKNSKIPILHDYMKRTKVAIAPDAPPKQMAAWTTTTTQMETLGPDQNHSGLVQLPQQAVTDQNGSSYRASYHAPQDYYNGQNTVSTGAVPRWQGDAGKNSRPYQHPEDFVANPQSVAVQIETVKEKDPTKTTKTMTKTYHTIKDMISGRFKNNKEQDDKTEDTGLNNITEEVRKTRNIEEPKSSEQIYGKTKVDQNLVMQHQYNQHMIQQHMIAQQQYQVAQPYKNQQIYSHQQLTQSRSQEMLAPKADDQMYYQNAYGAQRPSNRYGLQRHREQAHIPMAEPPKDDHRPTQAERRSAQQIERDNLRQKSFETRRAASHPQLTCEDEIKVDAQNKRPQPQAAASQRRGSHNNIIEAISHETEKDSDDGGFLRRNSAEKRLENKQEMNQHRSTDSKDESKVTEALMGTPRKRLEGEIGKIEGVYNVGQRGKTENDDIKNLRKHNTGSGASSDYDKACQSSSNADSGRGSAAYSSGRRPGGIHVDSENCDSFPLQEVTYRDLHSTGHDTEWVDIVESDLRHILEPKLHELSLQGNSAGIANSTLSESISSMTPPLPPLSPGDQSSPNVTPRNSTRFKHSSLPYGSKPDYGHDVYGKSKGSVPVSNPRWHGNSGQKHRSNKKVDHNAILRGKQIFGLDTTDLTSNTTRSLDLESMLDGQSDSDGDMSTTDARAIRKQLEGLESMYSEVLKLLGVNNKRYNGRYQPSDPRFCKRRYGSISSLPSSSVSSRPIRDKRRGPHEDRKKVRDIRGINKRFQRLESHVVTLARSVAHLSSEMRTQHLMIQEMETIRGEISALRTQTNMLNVRSQSASRQANTSKDLPSLANPTRVKKLTKFFGDEPPLLRLFLRKLGYEKYANVFENERVGMVELPYLSEERLQKMGVPLGPRLRIMQEAQISVCKDNTLCIV